MTMRQTAYLIRVLFSVLLLLAAAACRKDLGPDAGVPAEEGGMYLSISISADGGAAPAFKSPAPGENGDGAEAGTGAENVINDLNVFFFQGELDADDNRLGINSTTDPFLTCLYISEDELQSVQSVVGQYKYTFTREISSLGLEAGSTYDILVVANAGSSLGGIQTLAELRECIFEDKNDTGIRLPEDLIQGFDLMMSSASDASVTISDTNTSSSKADHVSVNLERMVARVDIKGNVNYDVEVEGRQDQVYIEYYLIVNNYKAGTYAFKRVTESLESDRTVYLGDESAVIPDGMTYGEVGNYVVDPKTLTPDDAGGNAYQNYFPTLDVGNPQDPYFNDVFQKLPEAGTGSTEFSKSTYVFENVLKSETLEQTALDDFCTGIIFRANYVPYGFKPGDSYYWYDNEAYKTLSGIGIEGVTEDNFENYGIRYYYLGWCYYTYWIRHADDNNQAKISPMEYAIVRNNVYRVTVNGVSGIGTPEPADYGLYANCQVLEWENAPEDNWTVDFGQDVYKGTLTEVDVRRIGEDAVVAYSQDNVSRGMQVSFKMETPEGAAWTAHLSDPYNFEFAGEYSGTGGGEPVTLDVRPTRPFEEGQVRTAWLYITYAASDGSVKRADDVSVSIRQVTTSEYDNAEKEEGGLAA